MQINPSSYVSFIKDHARTIGEMVVVSVLLLVVWYRSIPPKLPVNVPMAAAESPAVKDYPTKQLTCKPIIVYAGSVKNGNSPALPSSVVNNPDEFVIGSSRIEASDRSQDVTTAYNQKTGKTQAFFTLNPYPWFAAQNHKRTSFSYGVKNMGVLTWRAEFDDDLLQVKALHLGLKTTMDGDGQYFAGFAVTYYF